MARKPQENPQLDMTPMIDVVFELIIFFVVTIKAEDIFSELNGSSPAPGKSDSSSVEEDNQITIEILPPYQGKGAVTFKKKYVTWKELEEKIAVVAATSKTAPVQLRCDTRSQHQGLMRAMDICNKHGMYNLAIFTF